MNAIEVVDGENGVGKRVLAFLQIGNAIEKVLGLGLQHICTPSDIFGREVKEEVVGDR